MRITYHTANVTNLPGIRKRLRAVGLSQITVKASGCQELILDNVPLGYDPEWAIEAARKEYQRMIRAERKRFLKADKKDKKSE